MALLRGTSSPALRGSLTDDGFVIGRVSAQTLFLLGVTTGLGMAGGLLYLIVRGWIPPRWRIPSMVVFFGLVGGGGIIGTDGVDFTKLSPLPLAVAMFVAIPMAYGAVMPLLVERLLREGSVLRKGRWGWLAGFIGLAPLVLANVIGILVLLAALAVFVVRRAWPEASAAWRSRGVTWIGRALLVAAAVAGGAGLVSDAVEILG